MDRRSDAGVSGTLRAAIRGGHLNTWGLSLLAAAMDAAWITPYALLLGAVWLRPGTPLLTPPSLFGLLAGAQVVTRRLLEHGVSVSRARVVLVALGATAAGAVVAWQYGGDLWWRTHGSFWHAASGTLATFRPELPALVLAGLVWRRGIGVGRTELEYYDIEAIFYLGLRAFGVFATGMALGHAVAVLAATAASAFPDLLAFFAAGLIALPAARLRSVRRHTRASRSTSTVSGDWYALIAAAVVAILGIAAAAGAILRLDVEAVFHGLGPIVTAIIWGLLYVIAVPLALIVSGLVWVIRHLVHPGGAQPPHPLAPPAWIQEMSRQGTTGLPPGAATALRWGAVLIILTVAVMWLARAVFRYERGGKAPPADETRESVFSWSDLRAAWRAWFHTRPRPQAPAAAGPSFGTGAAAVVRRAYAELLALASALGTPRAQGQTPIEHAKIVGGAHPPTADAAGTLAAVYSRIRYGLAVPSENDLDAVRGALACVRAEAARAHGGEAAPYRTR